MLSPKQERKHRRIAREAGLKEAEKSLLLRDIEGHDPSVDAIFVSIDLEVSSHERGKPGIPHVKEFAIATFDTRCLRSRNPPAVTEKYISTLQFSTSHSSRDFCDCDVTDFKECLFAETFYISQEDLPAAITKCLSIQDDSSHDIPQTLRNIFIVAHSPAPDLQILERLGITMDKIAPVRAILDTHVVAQTMYGPDSTFSKCRATMSSFSLRALLSKLEYPYKRSNLHNAGNDATFTLHALLMLAIERCESRELTLVERGNLDRLRGMIELDKCRRWMPTRAALGFYAPESPY